MLRCETVVILVNYKSFQDTLACVKSLNSTNGSMPHIVVVDNASSTTTELDGLEQDYKNVRLIKSHVNVGFGRANNIGITWTQKNVDFDYLLLLNNDTLIEKDTIIHLQNAFKKKDRIGITTGKTMYESKPEIVWYGGGDINYKRGWPKIKDYNRTASAEGANKEKFVDFVSGCVMMFTKDSIDILKGFDENFFMYCEDLELCIRTTKKGFLMYYDPNAVIYHKVQGSTKKSDDEPADVNPRNSNSLFLFYHMKTNQYITMKKHLKPKDFYIFLFFYWAEYFRTILIMLAYGRFSVIWTGFKIARNVIFNKPAI